METKKIKEAATMLKEAERTVVLTGAGISTESGIPDFRSQDGLWKKYDPTALSNAQAIYENYDLFHQFFKERLGALWSCRPNRGHEALAAWEEEGLVQAIITQNIDSLHKKAGSHTIYEIHGNIEAIYCQECKKKSSVKEFLKKRSCQDCNGPLRPGVILFGEDLPQKTWREAVEEIVKADLLLVIGTSLQVSPVNQLPLYMGERGKRILINNDPTHMDSIFDLIFYNKAGDVLGEISQWIKDES